MRPDLDKPGKAAQREEKRRWIAQLDHAAARARYFHVLTEIFITYRRFDRLAAHRVQEASKTSPTDEHDIRELILHHLSFFSLPVQASALIRCPIIRRLLLRVQNQENPKAADAGSPKGGADEPDEVDLYEGALDEDAAMEKLLAHLKVLHRRGLIIVIFPTRATFVALARFIHERRRKGCTSCGRA